jgi:hypothetical protein
MRAPARVRLVRTAGVRRLRGDLDGAREALSEAWDLLAVGTCDRALAQREDARRARAAGDEPAAAEGFAAAIATFRAAGETWLAGDAAREAGDSPPFST